MATAAWNNSTAIESALATLHPLKDLSRNWDVDIASCLEEYLQEIGAGDLIQHMDDGEDAPNDAKNEVPNFAHAALILQNSSSVYTRKVDYLHNLVYKALYEFCRSGSSSSKESSRRKSADSDIEEFYDFDPHTEFLLLDDVVPEDLTKEKINLKSDDADVEGVSSSTPNQSGVSARNRTRLSLGGLSVTRLERSITGGFTSSAQQRALLGTINNGSLRLFGGQCDVGDDGVLMMPGSALLKPLEDSIMPHDSEQTRRSLFGEEPANGGTANNFSKQNDALNGGMDDDDGPGFEMNFEADDHDDGHVDQDHQVTEVSVAVQQQRRQVTFADPPKSKPRVDPWALLDPHSNGNRKPKPLRRGRTVRLPKAVDCLPSECVTGARTRKMPQRERSRLQEDDSVTKSLAADTFRSFLNDTKPPKIPIKGLVFKEFTYIAKQKAKERSQQRREERKKQAEEFAAVQAQNVGAMDDESDDEYGGGYDFGGDDDDYDDVGDNSGGNTGMASLDDAYNNDENENADDAYHSGKTFEELCRAHIRAFAKGAEEFAFNTQLSVRVDKWQAKLAPILEDEERRSAFDIHLYSKQLIEYAQEGLRKERVKRKSDGSIQSVTKTVKFEAVTQNCTKSDVCRMFLASLSLANSGNLTIDEHADSYRFDLISNAVELPMETFQAPSILQGT